VKEYKCDNQVALSSPVLTQTSFLFDHHKNVSVFFMVR